MWYSMENLASDSLLGWKLIQLSVLTVEEKSDLRSCEAVAKKAKKKIWGSNRIWTRDLHDTGAILYQLSYEALLETGQEPVQF